MMERQKCNRKELCLDSIIVQQGKNNKLHVIAVKDDSSGGVALTLSGILFYLLTLQGQAAIDTQDVPRSAQKLVFCGAMNAAEFRSKLEATAEKPEREHHSRFLKRVFVYSLLPMVGLICLSAATEYICSKQLIKQLEGLPNSDNQYRYLTQEYKPFLGVFGRAEQFNREHLNRCSYINSISTMVDAETAFQTLSQQFQTHNFEYLKDKVLFFEKTFPKADQYRTALHSKLQFKARDAAEEIWRETAATETKKSQLEKIKTSLPKIDPMLNTYLEATIQALGDSPSAAELSRRKALYEQLCCTENPRYARTVYRVRIDVEIALTNNYYNDLTWGRKSIGLDACLGLLLKADKTELHQETATVPATTRNAGFKLQEYWLQTDTVKDLILELKDEGLGRQSKPAQCWLKTQSCDFSKDGSLQGKVLLLSDKTEAATVKLTWETLPIE